MISSELIVWIGAVLAIGMIGWGVAGVIRGKVLVKSYGSVGGERRYARLVERDSEPAWFWTACIGYIGVGSGLLALIYFSLRHVAAT